jgi:hypothetical protein
LFNEEKAVRWVTARWIQISIDTRIVEQNSHKLSRGQYSKLCLAIMIFAALMAIRTEFSEFWLRATVAGCAGGVLGWGLIQVAQKKG